MGDLDRRASSTSDAHPRRVVPVTSTGGLLAADAEHDLLSHLLTVAQLPTARRLRCFRRAERHPSGRGFADLPLSAEEDTRSLLLGINPRSARRATDGRS